MTGLAVYQHLRALAERQVAAIEREDMATFNSLCDERDALMAHLAAPAEPALLVPAARLLAEVVALDRRMRQVLQAGLDDTRAELGQLRQGHRAVRAYGTDTGTARRT
ncbi:MAG: flagellar protein FliT [Chloroflexota bacterium]|nr:flagellar protein FliT [Chloroflexota bacterium]